MDTTERFYKIDQMLRNRGVVSVRDFLAVLEVSPATFKRDLQYLRDRLYAPIIWDREKRGYRFANPDPTAPRYQLPGLWFNGTEIHALLTMHHLLENLQPGLLGPHIEPLKQRIKALVEKDDHSFAEVARRIQVSADTRLGELHDIIQTAMGWTDDHLHQFTIGDTSYGTPDPHFPGDIKSEHNVRLDRVAAEGDTLIYEYDFGDGWKHEIEVEKVLPAEPGKHYPLCLAGKRACPPEDCGDMPGYERLLEVLRDPKHEEHEEMCEWAGGDFDPEAFDLNEINRALKGIR